MTYLYNVFNFDNNKDLEGKRLFVVYQENRSTCHLENDEAEIGTQGVIGFLVRLYMAGIIHGFVTQARQASWSY